MLQYASITHPGLRRPHNEDNLIVDEGTGLYLVADGMGGHEHGERASRMAVESIQEAMEAGSALVEAIEWANHRIREESGGGPASMGTTVCAALFDGNRYELAWVGDSRAYRFDGALQPITVDHTFVQAMINRGDLNAETARRHPNRSLLLQALGVCSDEELKVSSDSGELTPGTAMLLCTDGLTEELADADIEAILQRGDDPDATVQALLDAALDRGGHDNITHIFIQSHD